MQPDFASNSIVLGHRTGEWVVLDTVDPHICGDHPHTARVLDIRRLPHNRR
jgi:hypothetical protein